MNKKYKLVIPEMIKRDHGGYICEWLIKNNGEIVDVETKAETSFINFPGDPCLIEIPKEWLQEIKEPMTALEYGKRIDPDLHNPGDLKGVFYSAQKLLNAFKDGEENERLKHEPKMSFDDWYTDKYGDSKGLKEFARSIWSAYGKNRGYND